ASNWITINGLVNCSVDAGTSNTITVVRTGTNTILLEFDAGKSQNLGVMPISSGGAKCETWFRGFRYPGGFQYTRRIGDTITVVNYVDIEDYVKGVLPYEMNNAWPFEALKAQACCARTYALFSLGRHSSNSFDLCTTEHCQVYRGMGQANERTNRAAAETSGMYITYEGKLCETYYSSSNGGASENSENVWNEAKPYLRGVTDPYEADVASKIPQYNWTVTYTPAQLTQRLQTRGYNCSTIVSARVSKLTPTDNVYSVTLTDSAGKQITLSKRSQIITALGVVSQRFDVGGTASTSDGIYAGNPPQLVENGSPRYAINGSGAVSAIPSGKVYAITGSGNVEVVGGESVADNGSGTVNGNFVFSGRGRGHNVGMSQWGAYSMAEYHGKNYLEIINFYFTGVDVG
ncbi:MAG: SpoIID/LytB domain-containing protein, partial [Oscillospiraceae bacterium]|nr:SpoIID/LytB domain-containing protein [Oscillospiraceae bacterium]